MDVSNPLVSVIVPAYNRERFVGQAIASIVRQDHRPLEVIVADDGSTDGTAHVAESCPGLRVLRLPHGGVAAARNAAIAASSGALLAFLDSDDLRLPGNVAEQVAYLRENPEVGGFCGRARNFLEPGHPLRGWLTPGEFAFDPLSICSLLARREVFDRVGLFDAQFHCGEDLDWFFRARHAGIVLVSHPGVLIHRRIHDGNTSSGRGSDLHLRSRVARAHMSRARLGADRPGEGARATVMQVRDGARAE